MAETETRCPCGEPLHYSDRLTQEAMEGFIRELGPTILIRTKLGAWWVPRHFVALHGLTVAELPELALRYDWQAATDV